MRITGQNSRAYLSNLIMQLTGPYGNNSIMTGWLNADVAPKSEPERVYDYTLGRREGNTRIVGPESVSVEVTPGVVVNNNNEVENADGYVGDSAQGHRGDCYLMAEINAIRNTTHGQEVLNNNLSWHGEDSVTVTLPGAVKIRKAYEEKGIMCAVTGTYYITKEALSKARGLAGESFSKSEIETIAFEIAVENYRAEMAETKRLNPNIDFNKVGTAEFNATGTENDYLSGGYAYDAGFLLTGEKSEVYRNNNKEVEYYIPGKYGYITREELESQTGADISMYQKGKLSAGVSEVTHYSTEEQALLDMLDKYAGKEGDFALTCSIVVGQAGPDGHTKALGGHALTVVKITDDTVYCANPWYPDKIEPIPRSEFVKMCKGFYAMEVKDPTQYETPADFQSRSNVLQAVVGKINATHNFGGGTPFTVTPEGLRTMIDRHNANSSGNRLEFNRLIQLLNRISLATLSNDERERLRSLITSLSSADNNIDAEAIEYFEQKFTQG
ncbi:MAG: hypothetical protein K6E29_04495 [Cyanobacteria bacterium RUI128]|nr:hypothetical protein [Cyanobacteria bacterium RUI128]